MNCKKHGQLTGERQINWNKLVMSSCGSTKAKNICNKFFSSPACGFTVILEVKKPEELERSLRTKELGIHKDCLKVIEGRILMVSAKVKTIGKSFFEGSNLKNRILQCKCMIGDSYHTERDV